MQVAGCSGCPQKLFSDCNQGSKKKKNGRSTQQSKPKNSFWCYLIRTVCYFILECFHSDQRNNYGLYILLLKVNRCHIMIMKQLIGRSPQFGFYQCLLKQISLKCDVKHPHIQIRKYNLPIIRCKYPNKDSYKSYRDFCRSSVVKFIRPCHYTNVALSEKSCRDDEWWQSLCLFAKLKVRMWRLSTKRI